MCQNQPVLQAAAPIAELQGVGAPPEGPYPAGLHVDHVVVMGAAVEEEELVKVEVEVVKVEEPEERGQAVVPVMEEAAMAVVAVVVVIRMKYFRSLGYCQDQNIQAHLLVRLLGVLFSIVMKLRCISLMTQKMGLLTVRSPIS